MDANKCNEMKNRRGWRTDSDRFAFIGVCLCGKKIPHERTEPMLSVLRHCCTRDMQAGKI